MLQVVVMIEQNVVLQERNAQRLHRFLKKPSLGHPEICGLWLGMDDDGTIILSGIDSLGDMEEKLYCHSMEWC